MKKIILSIMLAGLLASCASKEAKEQPQTGTAKVEEVTVTEGTVPIQSQAQPQSTATTGAPAERSVYYDFDSYVIKSQYQPLIQAHGGYLSNSRNARVTVQGNCDERGSREYNLALGQKRADAVRNAMTVLGASKSQIETVSFGKEKPRCTEHSESCWSQNRRADIIY